MIVKGKAESDWLETRGSGGSQRNVHFTGKEIYLNSVTYLAGSENGKAIKIPIGVHTYNFECLLPESLPYSLEGKNGFIRYKVEAILDIPWGLDYKIRKPFKVARYDDLNLLQSPIYRRPCEAERIKTFGILCCTSDPLVLRMRVPKIGFGLGESIPVQMEIINNSSNNVYSTKLKLIKTEHYYSTSPSKSSKKISLVVISKNSRGVRAREFANFVEVLGIPRNLPTSNNRMSKIFQVKYQIYFKARTDSICNPPHMEIDITIGNVGITDDTTPLSQTVFTASQLELVAPTAPASAPHLQPRELSLKSNFGTVLKISFSAPSYEEATQCRP